MKKGGLRVVEASTVFCVRHTGIPSILKLSDLFPPKSATSTLSSPPVLPSHLTSLFYTKNNPSNPSDPSSPEAALTFGSGWEVLMAQSEVQNSPYETNNTNDPYNLYNSSIILHVIMFFLLSGY